MRTEVTILHSRELTSLLSSLINKETKTILEYAIFENNLTIARAFNAPKIFEVKRDVGDENLMKAVYGILTASIQFFNVKENLNDIQAIQTAAIIIENYPYETLEDICLCLKRAKTGVYGKVYNSLDGRNIIHWFKSYLDEKYEFYEEQLHKKKSEYYDQNKIMLENVAEVIKEIKTVKEEKQMSDKAGEEKEMHDLAKYLETATKLQKEIIKKAYEDQAAKNFWNKFERQLELINNSILPHNDLLNNS